MFAHVLFILLALGAVVSSLMVVLPPTGRNPLYAALALVVSFFFMAGLYVMLLAHLMAVLQIMVYAGAIMVLFLFVIMLLNLRDEELGDERFTVAKGVGALAVGFIAVKAIGLVTAASDAAAATFTPVESMKTLGTVDQMGDLLFRQFLFPFELTSILLLVAIVGAVVLAKRTL